MSRKMTEDCMQHIVARLLANAEDATTGDGADRDNLFAQGRRLAYYEMLDILKTELEVNDMDLEEYGLDIDLDEYI